MNKLVQANLHIFLLKFPMGLSFSSRTIHTSSMSLICSASCPSNSAELVSISGKRRRIVCAVMGSAEVRVVVVDILGEWWFLCSQEMPQLK